MRNYSRIFLATVITVFSVSCGDDSHTTACDVVNPVKNLPWLKTMIESWEANSTIFKYQYVQQGTYQGETVFMAANCCPFCDSYFPLYNCEGEELKNITFQEVKDLKTIWKPDNSECQI